MNDAPHEYHVTVNGGRCRVLEKGHGPVVGVIAGHYGLPRWTPFLEALSRTRNVRLLSPPGFPGSDSNHETLDCHLDWVAATLDLLDEARVTGGDLVAASIGAILAADVAALDPSAVRRLSLTAPYGVYHSAEPIVDFYAQTEATQKAMLCAKEEAYDVAFGGPTDPEEAARHQLTLYRAATAGARLVWPFGDRGLEKRLHRIGAPLHLMWGADDSLVPLHYMDVLAEGVPGDVTRTMIQDAGHLAWIDQPEAAASAVEAFLTA